MSGPSSCYRRAERSSEVVGTFSTRCGHHCWSSQEATAKVRGIAWPLTVTVRPRHVTGGQPAC